MRCSDCRCHGFASFCHFQLKAQKACLYAHSILEHTDFTVMMDHEAENSIGHCNSVIQMNHLLAQISPLTAPLRCDGAPIVGVTEFQADSNNFRRQISPFLSVSCWRVPHTHFWAYTPRGAHEALDIRLNRVFTQVFSSRTAPLRFQGVVNVSS